MKTRVACADLEAPVLQVELCLTELHEALKSGDIAALEDNPRCTMNRSPWPLFSAVFPCPDLV